jgi:major membrane immunogen (membrane-anchored lipoprotein)
MKKSLLGLAVMFFGFAIVACNGATTQAPTTAAPTTAAPTTVAPTTAAPTTVAPTTQATTVAPREFPVDGEFTAYEVAVDRNTPMVTTVTVTIEDGEITGYVIDCRQGTRTLTGEEYAYTWKPETKQELGFNYKMHWNTYAANDETPTIEEYEVWLGENDKLEWFEQANLIAAQWLANGVTSVTVDGEYIDNVAGVTIKDGGYIALAAAAVELARQGKFQAIYCSGQDLYSVSMLVSAEGVVSDLLLDTLQGQGNKTTGIFVWRDQTKQELGYGYMMHGNAYRAVDETPTVEEYEVWLGENDKLEWFEQVGLITDYVLANGYDENLQPITTTGKGGSLDGTTVLDDLAGVSVTSGSYYSLIGAVFAKVADGVIG